MSEENKNKYGYSYHRTFPNRKLESDFLDPERSESFTLPNGTEVIIAGSVTDYQSYKTLDEYLWHERKNGTEDSNYEYLSLPVRAVVTDRFHDGIAWRSSWVCSGPKDYGEMRPEIRDGNFIPLKQALEEGSRGDMCLNSLYYILTGHGHYLQQEIEDDYKQNPFYQCYKVRKFTAPHGSMSDSIMGAGFGKEIEGEDWNTYSQNILMTNVLAYKNEDGEWVDNWTCFYARNSHREYYEWLKSQPTPMSVHKPTEAELESQPHRWKGSGIDDAEMLPNRQEMRNLRSHSTGGA